MTFDEWLYKEYGDKVRELGLVVPELMRGAWQAAERDALERAVDAGMNAALDDMTNHAAFDTWRRVRNAIRALIEQDNKEQK